MPIKNIYTILKNNDVFELVNYCENHPFDHCSKHCKNNFFASLFYINNCFECNNNKVCKVHCSYICKYYQIEINDDRKHCIKHCKIDPLCDLSCKFRCNINGCTEKNFLDVDLKFGKHYNALNYSIYLDSYDCFLYLIQQNIDFKFHYNVIESIFRDYVRKGTNKYIEKLLEISHVDLLTPFTRYPKNTTYSDDLFTKIIQHPKSKEVYNSIEFNQYENYIEHSNIYQLYKFALKTTKRNKNIINILKENGYEINEEIMNLVISH
jgi:hypothetical protein